MATPDIKVKCFSQHVANGIYDCVSEAITNLGKDGLGEADFGIDWTMTVQDNYSGTNWSYVNMKDSCPFRTNIVGQIATSAYGTKHSAKGTHFTKKNIPLADSDTVKWKWALSKPMLCSPNLADIWENQLMSIEDWITKEKKRAAMGSKINPCIAKSANDLQYVDLIMLTLQHIYEKPEGKNASHDTTPQRTKRKITSEDSMVGQQSMAVSRSSMTSLSANVNVPTPAADKVSPGALYDPRILPDYWGTYFQLQQNKLKQLNLYNTIKNGLKLILMHETYLKLRPRTLVLAVCNAHVYNMVQNRQPTSTFQLSVQAMKVLDPSDEPVEEHFIPILSTTSIDLSKDNLAIAGFSTFDVAMNPAKKSKHADGQRHKGGKGKEKEGESPTSVVVLHGHCPRLHVPCVTDLDSSNGIDTNVLIRIPSMS
ncbi:uncharacterized protein F5147DRAFT_772477 [Suillus discolor]|uniref:Uncharacterized protein n=1 Tax=Suillus discolor TaxID=1912936 RepID=A0A9P7F9K4_9AGAM|nr:uncharacterized protein F5147DRAFT_772477 [Suillus discolor]KAG2110205.1 hypothetical protein F5147DRAFT_772477 [Suillus discolor]